MLSTEKLSELMVQGVPDDDVIQPIFEALGDRGRFRIFKLLMKYQDLCVTDVAVISHVSVSAVSQQCRILERAGLVQRVKLGQRVCYKIKSSKEVQKIVRVIQ